MKTLSLKFVANQLKSFVKEEKISLMLGVFVLVSMMTPSETEGSHYRYGDISWEDVGGNTVEFTVKQGWRTTFFYSSPSEPDVGDTVNLGFWANFNFGDGQSTRMPLTITSVNESEDWFFAEATFTHTYSSPGNYLANYENCCRIWATQNTSSDSYRNETEVIVGDGDNSPVTTVPPIINLPEGQTDATYQVPAVHPDGDSIGYRLANFPEWRGTSQPSGLSISQDGLITFDTENTSEGELYDVAVVIGDAQTKTIADFLIRIVDQQQATDPFFLYDEDLPSNEEGTPADGKTFEVTAGENISFPVKATDTSQQNLDVSISAVGAPPGANFSPDLPVTGDTAETTFDWTPTTNDLGSNVINFTAENDFGLQTSTSVSINVDECDDPQLSCQNTSITLDDGEATLEPNMVVDNFQEDCEITDTTLSQFSFDCSEIGDHPVNLTFEDKKGNSASCEATVTVVGDEPSVSITSSPASGPYTGGDPKKLYLGYGPQTTTLQTSVSGGSNFSYSWTGPNLSATDVADPTFSPTSEGLHNFTVTVTNEYGCEATASISICVQDVQVQGKPGKVYLCHVPPGKSQSQGKGQGQGPTKNTLSISTNAVPGHLNQHDDDYLGKCGREECSSNKKQKTTDLTDEASGSELRVYPNPAESEVTINTDQTQTQTFRLYNTTGQIIKNGSVLGTKTLEVGDLKEGLYMLEVEGEEKVQKVKVLIR